MKRLGWFFSVNLLVLMTISTTLAIIFWLFDIQPYFQKVGINYLSLIVFCAIFGFAGSILSLLSSRWMAKVMLGVKLISSQDPTTPEAAFLIKTVQRFMPDCGITKMPEIGVYHSSEVNAFATGATKNRALIAVSSGLLHRMDKNSIEGVIAHEMAHIQNGDMITMTLIQGVVNTFVLFFARVVAWGVAHIISRDGDDDTPPPYFLVSLLTFFFEIFLSILGSIAVAYFSRTREFKADEGGASLAGTHKMIHALEALRTTLNKLDGSNPSFASFKISGESSRILKLFATHPDLEERIARLKNLE